MKTVLSALVILAIHFIGFGQTNKPMTPALEEN